MKNQKEVISKTYAKALNKSKELGQNCCADQNCCDSSQLEISFGCYLMDEELNHFIRPGMTVIDFGSGPGRDLLLAAEIVGPKGKAIGIDMTDEMLDELKRNVENRGLSNVITHKADIENIDLESEIADVIISNCVINLTSDKQKVFNEAYRLLKPNGILLDADVVAEKELSKQLQENSELWCSCISGALTEKKYKEILNRAGFSDIDVKYAGKSQIQFESKTYGIHSALFYAKKSQVK